MNRTWSASHRRWLAGLGVALVASVPVVGQGSELPTRKAGQWEVTVRRTADPRNTQKVLQCTDRRAEPAQHGTGEPVAGGQIVRQRLAARENAGGGDRGRR